MRAFFERIVYYSTARLAAEQSEIKFPAVSRVVKRANRVKKNHNSENYPLYPDYYEIHGSHNN